MKKKRPNPYARLLSRFRPKVVKTRKGKGTYSRKAKHRDGADDRS
jgi:stalled ribosome alternative rescue factor ArfA